ncbi:MAG: hypothetical protein DRG82_07020 [Deltaproteobacteria bacterium]|nr:MAG: hypothetical protein B1H13_06580 [Desulfobacteraceae bacterium 4484_190.3]RLB17231.1 MAG: hypothetical protein DRG82_07020 [Deltaproteobacteria bacterium]
MENGLKTGHNKDNQENRIMLMVASFPNMSRKNYWGEGAGSFRDIGIRSVEAIHHHSRLTVRNAG